MTIREFYERDPSGRIIYPDGPPAEVFAPNWTFGGEDEMSKCYQNTFLPMSWNVPAIELADVADAYSCMGFMDFEESNNWLVIWICASIYAERAGLDESAGLFNVICFKLTRLLEASASTVPREAIVEFWRVVVRSYENDEELFDALIAAGIDPREG